MEILDVRLELDTQLIDETTDCRMAVRCRVLRPN